MAAIILDGKTLAREIEVELSARVHAIKQRANGVAPVLATILVGDDPSSAIYVKMMDRRKDLTEATSTPSLVSLLDMAKWRKEYIDWMQKAKVTEQAYLLSHPTNATTITQ